METCRVFISGFVQGVGYRRFVKHNAVKLGLKGWVKNLPDNRVEAVLQGGMEDVRKMILICKKGPFLSEIKDIVVDWEKGSLGKFTSFEILR